jgi:uncharacterized protein (TIGR02147 family)
VTLDYRQYLLSEFKKRSVKNPQYSLRAFARDLCLSPSRLSEALNRKCGISPKKATRIADIIGLSQTESQCFVTLVEAEHGRSKALRIRAASELEKLGREPTEKTLELEWLKYFTSWHHTALLELVFVTDFKPLPIWIARRLGISVVDARDALNRLLYLGLLKIENGKVYREPGFLASPTDVASSDGKRIQREFLKKAEESLNLHPLEKRDITATTFPIDSKKIKAAKLAIKNFQRKFCQEFVNTSDPRDRVYTLAIQLFALDQEPSL